MAKKDTPDRLFDEVHSTIEIARQDQKMLAERLNKLRQLRSELANSIVDIEQAMASNLNEIDQAQLASPVVNKR